MTTPYYKFRALRIIQKSTFIFSSLCELYGEGISYLLFELQKRNIPPMPRSKQHRENARHGDIRDFASSRRPDRHSTERKEVEMPLYRCYTSHLNESRKEIDDGGQG